MTVVPPPNPPGSARSLVCRGLAFAAVLLVPALLRGDGSRAEGKGTRPQTARMPVPQADADLPSTLRVIHKSIGRPVVAEVPTVERRLAAVPTSGILSEVLERASATFHLYFSHRSSGIVLHLRYVDAQEDHNLEVRELRLIVSDMHRLVTAVCPHQIDLTTITDKRSFLTSLSPEQMQAARSATLRFSDLTGAQQAMWRKINLLHGYGDILLHSGKAMRLFDAWNDVELTCDREGGRVSKLVLRYTTRSGASESLAIAPLPLEPSSATSATAVRTGDLPPAGRTLGQTSSSIPGSFKKSIESIQGAVELGAVCSAMTKATGTEVRVPLGYDSRRLLVFASRNRADDLLRCVLDLYGWTIHEEARNRFILRRPVLSRPVDATDFHRKVRNALPPALHLQWSPEAITAAVARSGRRLHYVVKAAEELGGKGWASIKVSDLQAKAQQQLGAVVVDRLLADLVFARYVRRSQAPRYLVTPESGSFALSDPTGADTHPLFRFSVQRPDGGFDQWGWLVGTSSLGR